MKKTFIFIFIFVFFTSGCYTLRKKFVRKKTYQKEPPVYVDFKDYNQEASPDTYVDSYLYLRGWLDELSETLRNEQNFKREKRAINETIKNFNQIVSFYNTQGKEAVTYLGQNLTDIKDEIEKNPYRDTIIKNNIVRKIDDFRRKFETDCKYSNAKQWMN